MRMYDIITDKKAGRALTDDQLHFWITGVTNGSIPDYQTAALLMAICWQGLNAHETAVLTAEMAHSGDTVDLSGIEGIKVDKHSTGGVGDKTSLIVAPLVAACGVKMAKMSGRGLGHTGGTIDKLESIPGFRTALTRPQFTDTVNRAGLCIIAQSGDIAPADKMLYALRDVTATVNQLSLIASSIMSKKLASGADVIVLDVKVGSGAFMKTQEDAVALAKAMVNIGVHHGRKIEALITDMDKPLGRAVGNAIEVREAVDTLRGHGPADLTELCLSLCAAILTLAGKQDSRHLAEQALLSGAAFEKFKAMIAAQGGDTAVLDDPAKLPLAPLTMTLTAPLSGFVTAVQTEAVGLSCVALGAGRTRKQDDIDSGAGLYLHKTTGDAVKAGEPLMTLYASTKERLSEAAAILSTAVIIGDRPPDSKPIVLARVMANDVTD